MHAAILLLVATGNRAIQSTKPSIDAASSNKRAIIFLSILVPGDGGEPSEDSACNRLEWLPCTWPFLPFLLRRTIQLEADNPQTRLCVGWLWVVTLTTFHSWRFPSFKVSTASAVVTPSSSQDCPVLKLDPFLHCRKVMSATSSYSGVRGNYRPKKILWNDSWPTYFQKKYPPLSTMISECVHVLASHIIFWPFIFDFSGQMWKNYEWTRWWLRLIKALLMFSLRRRWI